MKTENMKKLIKESIREVLKEERMSLYEALIPYVSKNELKEIHKKFKTPKDHNEDDFIDMTDWVKK